MSSSPQNSQKDVNLLRETFEEYFDRELPGYASFPHGVFENERDWAHYFKRTCYFRKTVINPLEQSGLRKEHSIIDIASGSGPMSLALLLLGFPNVTMYDLCQPELNKAQIIIQHCLGSKAIAVPTICGSAMAMDASFDALISYQTLEHLSDDGIFENTGVFPAPSRACQREFLRRVNINVRHLCYFNAPNYVFPVDGHDSGKLLFHYLPVRLRRNLVANGWVKGSWKGVALPVSLRFLRRNLPAFELFSRYYAFQTMQDYMESRSPFNYMGNLVPHHEPGSPLPMKKRLVAGCASLLGKQAHNLLPYLSVIFRRVSGPASAAV